MIAALVKPSASASTIIQTLDSKLIASCKKLTTLVTSSSPKAQGELIFSSSAAAHLDTSLIPRLIKI